ncbi:acyltransferase family protein [Bradyrhizobium symbiodeficiens]|uniref:Acyltransferase n=1 Tax=Bradyrhizobium symbiodeficiens TaxID=1404367 RepID=A0A6G8ZZB6_9BRAD|nr:acyltransferase [Bradyrhizobium symbiodeficiens]QIP05498.1 acyltransferase [Bradyrhizobium symbiodeficiens]
MFRVVSPLIGRSVTFQDKLISVSFRGPGFDHVRLFAAIIVLLHHCRGIQYYDFRDDPLLQYSGGFLDFGRFAVITFFAISGFLVTPSLLRTGNVIDYAVHRSMRIFPALIVVVALTMLLLGPAFTTETISSYFRDPQTYRYAKNVFTSVVDHLPGVTERPGTQLSINGSLWTLHFEVLCYILLGSIGAIGMLSRRNAVLALWCTVYAVYAAICMIPSFAAALPARISTFVSLFVYFGSGVLLYLFRERVPFSIPLASAAIALLLLALPLGGGPLTAPICLPYLMVLCGLSNLSGRVSLKKDLSYGIYLIHAPVLFAFSLTFPGVHTWWIGAVVVVLLTSILAYASWVFVERPALNKKKAAAVWVQRRIGTLMQTLVGRPPTRATGRDDGFPARTD